MPDKPKTGLEVEMFHAMVELLGHGYVPSYYEQAAADFLSIARSFGAKEEVNAG